MDVRQFQDIRDKVVDNVSRVIVGKNEQIQLVLTACICGGHVLLEDVPGTGKTMLLRAFARTLGGDFKRIQFTPDLLPSDLTGINFYDQKAGEFRFRPGPLFAHIILADEINRATPRTQSSLLEAMEEKQISVDGASYPLEEPFLVMATQNPLESYGTFPLPEAQLDRFFMRLSLGYMSRVQEMQVMARPSTLSLVEALEPVVERQEILALRAAYPAVAVQEPVLKYMMDIVEITRQEARMGAGVSTRGAMALYRASQVTAALSGRDFVIPEDVQALARPVLAHRMGAGSSVNLTEAEGLMGKMLERIPVPLEKR